MLRPRLHGCALLLAFFLFCFPLRAADPLRLAPESAEFVLKVEQPAKIVQIFDKVYALKEFQGFAPLRELYDSTNFRRVQQAIAYFEKEMGRPFRELIEPLAGGGAVLAGSANDGKPTDQQKPAVFVIQGKDAAAVQKFARVALTVITQELVRQESKDKVELSFYQGFQIAKIGAKFHAAVIDAAVVGSESIEAIKAAIDRRRDPSRPSLAGRDSIIQARKMLPADTLAWGWIDIEHNKGVKDVFATFDSQPFLRVPFGGLLDVASRSPFAIAAIRNGETGPAFSIHFPRGRNGMNEAVMAHAPPAGKPGALPLLQPKGVLYSGSFYFDLPHLWEKRNDIMKPSAAVAAKDQAASEEAKKQLQQVEEADKQLGTFLLGTRPSKLISYMGPRHRIVVTKPRAWKHPEIIPLIPDAALIVELRDPEAFTKAVEAPLRAYALIAGLPNGVKIKLVEEKHGDAKIVGFHIQVTEAAKNIVPLDILAAFRPCIARVGDQFIFSSSFELTHQLIDELQKEKKTPIDRASMRSRLDWHSLLGLILPGAERQTVDVILAQGVFVKEAHEQSELLGQLLRKLFAIEAAIHCEADAYRMEFRLTVKDW